MDIRMNRMDNWPGKPAGVITAIMLIEAGLTEWLDTNNSRLRDSRL